MKNKLKKYAIHWSANVSGFQYVYAFDEHDAYEQFDSIIYEDSMPDQPVYAELNYVEEVKEKKKK